MNRPWFKLYAADTLIDAKLDSIPIEAHGLVLKMWCLCHIEGSCPNNPAELARKLRCNLDYVLLYKSQCEPLFELRDTSLVSTRMESENRRSDTNRQNANDRWKQKDYEICIANGNAKSKDFALRVSDNDSDNDSDIELKNRPKNFIAPTIEEVTAYCAERKSPIDPIKFWNYYETCGWTRNRTKMKKWKTAIVTWERNLNGGNGNGQERLSAGEQLQRKNREATERYLAKMSRGSGDDLQQDPD